MSDAQLNERAWSFVESQLACNEWLKESCSIAAGGGRILDCGITGGYAAGLFLARLTLCDLAEVSIGPGEDPELPSTRSS